MPACVSGITPRSPPVRPVRPRLRRDWQAMTGVPLVNGYGTTETLSLVLYRNAGDGRRPTTHRDPPGQLTSGRARDLAAVVLPPASRSVIRAWSPTTARASPTAASPRRRVPPCPDGKAGCSPAAATSSSGVRPLGGRGRCRAGRAERMRGKAEEVCVIPAQGEGRGHDPPAPLRHSRRPAAAGAGRRAGSDRACRPTSAREDPPRGPLPAPTPASCAATSLARSTG